MFIKILKQLMAEKKIKNKDFSEKIGISPNQVRYWEKHGNIPKYEVLKRIADYFGVTTDYLLGKEGDKPLSLTDEENELITKYRAAGEETRTAVKKILDIPLPSISDDIASTVAQFSPVHTDKK